MLWTYTRATDVEYGMDGFGTKRNSLYSKFRIFLRSIASAAKRVIEASPVTSVLFSNSNSTRKFPSSSGRSLPFSSEMLTE